MTTIATAVLLRPFVPRSRLTLLGLALRSSTPLPPPPLRGRLALPRRQHTLPTTNPHNPTTHNPALVEDDAPLPYPPPIPTYTPTPPPTGVRLILRRIRESFQFVGRFKKTLLELFFWMICGSLALELRWLRRDKEEFEETMGVRGRKLEAEIRALSEDRSGREEVEQAVQAAPAAVPKAVDAVAEPSATGPPRPKRMVIY
ncbi:hypothetical protein HDU87_007385 [Geranomyces variabilis]|uniref:Uncharacterized protein n=1 Tax=Geranomyces variabilis TaxID=109894 RepID=A0AAD5TPA8_9FUNG|nr:hypothetical protein HDU87_007385 [Geranomyces variabilis]